MDTWGKGFWTKQTNAKAEDPPCWHILLQWEGHCGSVPRAVEGGRRERGGGREGEAGGQVMRAWGHSNNSEVYPK